MTSKNIVQKIEAYQVNDRLFIKDPDGRFYNVVKTGSRPNNEEFVSLFLGSMEMTED